jgi:hypothetical protein
MIQKLFKVNQWWEYNPNMASQWFNKHIQIILLIKFLSLDKHKIMVRCHFNHILIILLIKFLFLVKRKITVNCNGNFDMDNQIWFDLLLTNLLRFIVCKKNKNWFHEKIETDEIMRFKKLNWLIKIERIFFIHNLS